MSDDDYSDEEFDAAPPSKSPSSKKPSAKSALLAAAASVEEEEVQQLEQQENLKPNLETSVTSKKDLKKKSKKSIPSASVPLKKSKKKKKKQPQLKQSNDIKPYQSRIWNSQTPGFTFNTSHFTKSVELMKASGFNDIFATGGTKIGSSLMHSSYAGDTNAVSKILKGVKVKSKKSRYDSDSDDSSIDSISKKVVGWSTVRAGKSWECDLIEKDEQGWTCMHYAASKGKSEVVEALVKADEKRIQKLGGGEEEEEENDDFGLGDGNVKTLLVNIKDDLFGWTPLFLACIELHVSTVSTLLENGGNANLRDDLGDTPLDCVMKTKKSRKRTEIRRMLKEWMEDEEGVLSSESEEESESESSSDED